jgi:hypothetical protein
MPESRPDARPNSWHTSVHLVVILLLVLGGFLIYVGARFPQGSIGNQVFISMGVSLAPAALIAELFQVFLLEDLRYQVTDPMLDAIRDGLGPEIRERMERIVERYREEIETLKALRDAGVITPHRRREQALQAFSSAIDAETNEITIVGSSLKGLMQREEYRETAEKLQFKVKNGNVRVRFLLTHPVVADLRAGQEARRHTEIGQEIIQSLCTLKEWGVPPENVRLYKGTPTCFAIKTGSQMLLNPYPYGAVAYDSPCLIVKTSKEHPSYFYDAFDRSHFGAWDTNVSTKIYDYDVTARELRDKLGQYSDLVQEMLKA